MGYNIIDHNENDQLIQRKDPPMARPRGRMPANARRVSIADVRQRLARLENDVLCREGLIRVAYGAPQILHPFEQVPVNQITNPHILQARFQQLLLRLERVQHEEFIIAQQSALLSSSILPDMEVTDA